MGSYRPPSLELPPTLKMKTYYPELLSTEDYNWLMQKVHDFRHAEGRSILTDLEVNFAAYIVAEKSKEKILTEKQEEELFKYWDEISEELAV